VSDLLAARFQMGLSLAFHIVFAVVGIASPAMMVIAERRWRASGDSIYLDLAKRWARGTAILFAVGAVSGTVLSFELGLLWPGFMRVAGPVIGMPFSLEGFAFFTEAIFLGVYLYGWDRVTPRAHLLAGVVVAVSGALSGVFVVIANAWMNAPTGFTLAPDGSFTDIHPLQAMANPAALSQVVHMTLAAYAATGLAVAGIHAGLMLRGRSALFHRHALIVALTVGAPAAVLQPLSGDLSARFVARHQPAKLAAMEGLFETRDHAPLAIGGWPDTTAQQLRFAIEIPSGLSLLAFHEPSATVTGLDQVPRDEWPNIPAVHLSFQVMVGLGTYMAFVGLWGVWLVRQKGASIGRGYLRALAWGTPFGFIAIEAGWMATELGRQPWIIYRVLRTSAALTPMPGQPIRTAAFVVLYAFLAVVVTVLLSRQILGSPVTGDTAELEARR